MKFFAPVLPRRVLELLEIPRGDQALAAAQARDGRWLIGTRGRLFVVATSVRDLGWDQIEDASWNGESGVLSIRLLAPYGEPTETISFELDDSARLLQLIRERITASIIVQRRGEVSPGSGFRVLARRNPVSGPLVWMTVFDEGLDPESPQVKAAVEEALQVAQHELGQ
ncbi:MAG: hypothetical protein M9946_03675 [Nocardioidaceae bacterium]|nr:hypothetical protein [Nocardioidaceae bacterium]